MKISVTGAQMKQIDQDTIMRIGIPSMVLMERAALAVADEVKRMAGGDTSARIWIACGTGNNGADGIAAGRILYLSGYEVTVLLAGNPEHATPENRQQRTLAEQIGVMLVEYPDFIPGECDIIVDAIFGIGLGRPVEGQYRDLIAMLAAQQTDRRIAVDIPSGIHSDTGAVMGTAFSASVTVTFGYLKTGLLFYPGKAYAGRVVTADIGFSDISLSQAGWDAKILELSDLKNLPKRKPDANKGTFGKVLLIAGSRKMSGAAYLSALAAYRTGAGLVRIFTVEDNREILLTQLPEALLATYRPEDILEREEDFGTRLEQQCGWATAVVLGPGLSTDAYAQKLVELVLTHVYVPTVLDADALNIIAAHPELTDYYTDNIIVTPHIGEMGRLTGLTAEEIKSQAVQTARDYSSSRGVTCVMKDAVTVTAEKDGGIWINGSGNSGMAKAGSGDVLAGIIGGLLAQGMEPCEAAAYGAYVHGLAGDAAVRQIGKRGLLARDIADHLWDGAEDKGGEMR